MGKLCAWLVRRPLGWLVLGPEAARKAVSRGSGDSDLSDRRASLQKDLSQKPAKLPPGGDPGRCVLTRHQESARPLSSLTPRALRHTWGRLPPGHTVDTSQTWAAL